VATRYEDKADLSKFSEILLDDKEGKKMVPSLDRKQTIKN
jgi:hypothetical protein